MNREKLEEIINKIETRIKTLEIERLNINLPIYDKSEMDYKIFVLRSRIKILRMEHNTDGI